MDMKQGIMLKTSLYTRKSCVKRSGHNIQLKICNVCNAFLIKQSSILFHVDNLNIHYWNIGIHKLNTF